MEGIGIIYGLPAPKGDEATMVCYADLVAAAEQGLLEISPEDAEQAWIDMTEKQGVNNDGSDCVDQSKLFTEPPLLAASGSDPTIGGSPEADLMTAGGRRLKYKAKARRLTERAHERLRRHLLK